MLVRVIGSSPAWPNPGGAQSGVLLEDGSPGRRLLVDCGPGVLASLRAGGLLPVDAVLISHFHLDHFGDLVPWCWLSRFAGSGRPDTPALHVPRGGGATLAGFAAAFGTERMFEETFAVAEYEPGQAFDAAGFVVEPVAVSHYDVPAHGFRVRGPSGCVVAFSGDTGPTAALAELARGADLFVCEATLGAGSEDGPMRGHLTADEARAAAGATRLLLTHRPAELAPPPGACVAYDGLTLDLAREAG